ncbi:MAG TPA: hypothetical protein VHL98_10685 [Microvirga sp.]|jgi:hypothetical protein|nr:hypothetical protein [Microvirga sp.]
MEAKRIIRAAVMAALLVAASGASAQEEGVAMKSILGSMGIIPKDRPPIEYRERAPLVVPPKLELRAPLDHGSVETRVPNWPKDPDVVARQRDAADSRKAVRENSRLSPDEIQSGRRAQTAGRPIERPTEKSTLTPDELRSMDPRTSTKPVLAGVEPERRSLTEPPSGYRKPASNAPMRASADPVEHDPDSPGAFQREMERRR